MLHYLFTFLYVLICFLLLMVVLLQQGKGGDIAAAFGGSSSQAAFGARSGATLLTRATSVLAVLFMLGALALAVVWERGPGSVVGNAPAPASVPVVPMPGQPAPGTMPPASAPAQPAPASQGSTPQAPAQPPAPVKK